MFDSSYWLPLNTPSLRGTTSPCFLFRTQHQEPNRSADLHPPHLLPPPKKDQPAQTDHHDVFSRKPRRHRRDRSDEGSDPAPHQPGHRRSGRASAPRLRARGRAFARVGAGSVEGSGGECCAPGASSGGFEVLWSGERYSQIIAAVWGMYREPSGVI